MENANLTKRKTRGKKGAKSIIMLPLDFWDLSLFLAVMALILMITSNLLLPHNVNSKILINNKRLEKAAIIVSSLFLITVILRIINSIIIL